jgi:YVTN family beta-propeller protein
MGLVLDAPRNGLYVGTSSLTVIKTVPVGSSPWGVAVGR